MFESLTAAPPDAILGLNEAARYNIDVEAHKAKLAKTPFALAAA